LEVTVKAKRFEGVYDQWVGSEWKDNKSRKKYVAQTHELIATHMSQLQTMASDNGRDATSFASSFERLSNQIQTLALLEHNVNPNDQAAFDLLCRAVRYHEVGQTTIVRFQFRELAPDFRSTEFLTDIGGSIAAYISFGWLQQAKELALENLPRANRFAFFTTSGARGMLGHFVFRLAADWLGVRCEIVDSPARLAIFDDVMKHWRDEDPSQLALALLKVMDWHTWSTKSRSNSYTPDLRGGFVELVWPMEVHAVLRLREELGLANPELDHIMTRESLFGPPIPRQHFYQDKLLNDFESYLKTKRPMLAEQGDDLAAINKFKKPIGIADRLRKLFK
jgi:hypothetical protein